MIKQKVVFQDDMVNHIYGILELDLENNSLKENKLVNPTQDSNEGFVAINEHIKQTLEIMDTHIKNNRKYYVDMIESLKLESIIVIRFKKSEDISIQVKSLYSVPVMVREEVI